MKIYTQNFVTSIHQTKQKTKDNLQTVTQPKLETNLNKIPYNYNNITFGSNVEVIAKMEQLAKSKNCKMEDLYKLFKELTAIAQANVNDLIKKFNKEGLKADDYIKACVKQPSLFYQSPETIEKNVRNLVEKFNKEGLKADDYIKACVKSPSLFCQSPETIEKNVRNLVEKFNKEGLKADDYIKACVKRPSLFCQSPETIAEHIRAFKYVEQNNGKLPTMQDIMKKNLVYSTLLIYLLGIIRPQIRKQSSELANLGLVGLKPKLVEYFKEHPKAQFKIKVLDNEMSGNFVKTIQEFSDKEFGRTDAFVYEFVKN